MWDIEDKIREIRQEPEHIRMRWVWGVVSAIMLVIILIWLLSMRLNLTSKRNVEDDSYRNITDSIGDVVNDNPDTPSLDELITDNKNTRAELEKMGKELEAADQKAQQDPGVSLDSILETEQGDQR